MSDKSTGRPTATIDALAAEIQKNQFRGSILGQQGLYIDKRALRLGAMKFNLSEFSRHAEEAHARANTLPQLTS